MRIFFQLGWGGGWGKFEIGFGGQQFGVGVVDVFVVKNEIFFKIC